jgi:hypothetical protein
MMSLAAPPRRVRAPSANLHPRIAFTIPELARMCGWTRRTMLRRFRASDCAARPTGKGKRRERFELTISDLRASNLAWILDEIRNWAVEIERLKRPAAAEEDPFDDDEPGEYARPTPRHGSGD